MNALEWLGLLQLALFHAEYCCGRKCNYNALEYSIIQKQSTHSRV